MVASGGKKRGGGTKRFEDLVSGDINRKEFAPVYLLAGEDAYRIESVVGHIRRQVLGDGPNASFNDHVFRGDESDIERVLQQARSFPMLGGRQVVWLRDAELCVTDDRTGNAVAAYAGAPVPETVLILSATKLDKRRRWVKAFREAGSFYEFAPPEGRELRTWAAEAARRAGLELPAPSLELLVELVGGNLHALAGEIDKLALLAEEKGRPPGTDEIVRTVMDQAELEVFTLNGQLAPGNAASALKTWFRMAEWEHSSHSLTPLLLYKLRTASIVAALAEQGVPPGDIPRESGLNPWVVRTQMLPLARQLGPDGIRRALRAGARSDAFLKSSPVAADIVLERLILEICGVDESRG